MRFFCIKNKDGKPLLSGSNPDETQNARLYALAKEHNARLLFFPEGLRIINPTHTGNAAEVISREDYKAKTGSSSAFQAADRFIIYNTTTGKWIESHFSNGAAQHFTRVLNDHNNRNGHPDRYDYKHIKVIDV